MVDEELKGDWANKDFRPDRLLYHDDEAASAPPGAPITTSQTATTANSRRL